MPVTDWKKSPSSRKGECSGKGETPPARREPNLRAEWQSEKSSTAVKLFDGETALLGEKGGKILGEAIQS